MINTREIGDLDIEFDDVSGQILVIHDRTLDMQVISFHPGHELELNRLPLALYVCWKAKSHSTSRPGRSTSAPCNIPR